VIIAWEEETGNPGPLSNEMAAKLNRRISQYKRGGRDFKIGITSNPDRRAMEYDSREGGKYDEMVVLYRTRSPSVVRDLESRLVSKHQKDSDNEQGGGGGPLGNPPYYLYIVRSLTGKEWWAKFVKPLKGRRR